MTDEAPDNCSRISKISKHETKDNRPLSRAYLMVGIAATIRYKDGIQEGDR